MLRQAQVIVCSLNASRVLFAMEIDALLSVLSNKNGSDLFLSTGAPPSARIDGVLTALSERPFKNGETAAIAASLMDAEQRREFDRDLEMNLAISRTGIGRFRVNIFKQRNDVSIVIRNVKLDIPRFADLKLPAVLLETVMLKQGLILFVGATDSGKSTSLAALIDHRNRHSSGAHHHHRGSDRVHPSPPAFDHQSTGSRGRYAQFPRRPEKHPASGTGCGADRRNP